MKNLLTVLSLLLLYTGLFAQNDTLYYPIENATGVTLYGYTGGGYIAGPNIDGTDVGQTYQTTSGDLTSFIFAVGAIDIVGTPDTFYAEVYSVDVNGLPVGAPLARKGFRTDALVTGPTIGDGFNLIEFDAPVAVSGEFAITFDFDLTNRDDTIGIYTNADGDGLGLERSIAKFGGIWYTINLAYSLDLDLFVFPILENVSQTYNLDLTEVRCGEYSSYPESQIQPITFGATVENTGNQDIQLVNASVSVTELNGNTQVYNPSIPSLNGLVPPIAALSEETVVVPSIFASYTPPAGKSAYRVDVELEYGVSPFTSGDPTKTTSNTYFFAVDDSVYARDEAILLGGFDAVGTGSSNGFGMGQSFLVVTADTLSSVSFVYSGDSTLWIGEDLQVNIYNHNSATGPGALVASTNAYTIPDDSARFVTLNVQNGPLVLSPGDYFVEVNNAPSLGYSEAIATEGAVFVQTGTNSWALLDTITSGLFPGSFMIRPNFGKDVQQQQAGNCDTLLNVNLGVDSLAIWGNTTGGSVSGHNGDGFTNFAEKFTSPYANTEINGISFFFGRAETSNPAAFITATVWDDDGGNDFFNIPNAPGTVLATQNLLISDIVTDVNNQVLTSYTFPSPLTVSGDFYVGFEVVYASGDTVALVTNRDESIPATFYTGFTGVWGRADSIYLTNISGFVLADICEAATPPAPVANFTADRFTLMKGNTVQFTDLSSNTPSSWTWAFQGGTPTSSNQENPLVNYNNEGLYDVSLDVSNAGGSDAVNVPDLISVLTWPALPACDTVSNIDFVNDNFLKGSIGPDGYFAGHNAYGDLSKAELFSGLNAGDELSGVALGFDVAKGTGSIDVNVWDNTGTGGTPGAIVATETVSIPSIATDISNNSLTYVSFASPLTLSSGVDYYIGISLTYAAGDSVSLYSTEDGQAAIDIAWEQWSDGSWHSFSDAAGWEADVSLLINPLVCPANSCPTIGTTVATTDASCGNADGTATVTATGGAAPYTYEWSDAQTTATATALVAGTYTVTVSDNNACTAVATANVSDSGSPTVTLDSKGDVSCNGETDGYISVLVSGGVPSYTYVWSNGGNTATLTGLGFGTYTLTVTDNNGCSETFSETITEPTVLSPSATATDLTCASVDNGTVDLTVSGGTASYTYDWSNGATTEDLSGLAAGTYTVTVTDANGCTSTASATVSNPANPLSVSVSNATTNTCGASDASLTANVSGGSGSYTYAWTGGANAATATNLNAGNYTVTVTDASSCTATATATVSDPATFTVSVTTSNITCNGLSDGSATAVITNGSGSETFSWSNGGNGSTVSNLAPGQVSVTVSEGGCSAVSSATITEPNAISVSVTQTDVTCNGGSNGTATAFVTGGTGSYTYEWLTSPIQTGASVTGLAAGSVILNVKDASNCQASPVTVTTVQPSDISASTNITPVTCYGDNDGSVQLTVSGATPPYSYNWSGGGTSSLVTGLSAGTYSVTVSDINNCEKILSALVVAPDSISITTSNVTNVSCNGLSDGSVSLNVTGGNAGFNYAWSNGQNTTSATLSNLAATNYFVTATDAKGCQKVSASITVTQPQALSLSTSFSNVTCAQGADGDANVVANGGTAPFTYAWSSSSNTDSLETGLSAGPVSVTVTDANLCTASASVNIADGNSPTASTSVTNANANANDGTATVTATNGTAPYTYLWDDNAAQTTATATGLDKGNYTVVVTDANGCTTTASAVVDRSVSVANITDIENLQIFPNPTSGTVNLKIELGTAANVEVEWVNVLGATINMEHLGTTMTVNKRYDLAAFAAGIYFAKIRINEELIVRKVIVSKQ